MNHVRTPLSLERPMLSSAAGRVAILALAAAFVGCGGDDDAGTLSEQDSGGTDTAITDSGSSPKDTAVADTTPSADGGTDTTPATDSGTDSTPAETGDSGDAAVVVTERTTTVAISADGHDRFYNAIFDATGASIYAVGQTADGKDFATDFKTVLTKFKADGTVDTSFGTAGTITKNFAVGTNGELARGIAIQASGKIIVSGTIEHPIAATPSELRDRDVFVARFNTDGTLDTTFGTAGVATLDLSDGELVGSTYYADSQWSVRVDSTDRLIVNAQKKVGGGTSGRAANSALAVVRLTKDGAIDTTFGTAGSFTLEQTGKPSSARGGTILADGSIIGSGYSEPAGVGSTPILFKLTSAGVLDTTFHATGATPGVFFQGVLGYQTEAYAAVAQGDKLITTGYGKDASADLVDWVSMRFTAAGELDTTYGSATPATGVARIDLAGQNDNSRSLVVLPDQRVFLSGGGSPTATNTDGMLGLLSKDGVPVSTFGTSGHKTYDFGGPKDFLWGVALSPAHDRIAIAGIKGFAAATSTTPSPDDDDAVLVLVPAP